MSVRKFCRWAPLFLAHSVLKMGDRHLARRDFRVQKRLGSEPVPFFNGLLRGSRSFEHRFYRTLVQVIQL
jgi:hypothetical protein